MNNSNNTHRFIPLIISLGIVVGLLLGDFYANRYSGKRLSIINSSSNKLTDILHAIDELYVDTVNIDDVVDNALPAILKELDPHSTYTPAEEVEQEMQALQGHFSGIGIQFRLYRDTVNVIRIIPGGPSEGTDLKAGDRIVRADGKNITGKDMTSDKVMKILKGIKGSTIKLGVVSPGNRNKIRNIDIVRGDVPVSTVEASYMIEPNIGYIQISAFGSTTYSEFISALAQLNTNNLQKLIIDLRGNLGGYMEAATQIANEFLPAKRLIVYTQGRTARRENFSSDGRGVYQNMPLVVLVDEYSASASEIFAGAMQDNDRATIIGRRTFGKGLVQVPMEFRDGSMLRLTHARYYTPSGRCVQKPYQHGDPEDQYEKDLINREMSGELFSADSIKTNGKVYKTRNGRKVYGGGGIIPDVFVPLDTLGYTPYLREASMRGLLVDFSYNYTDTNRKQLLRQSDIAAYLLHADLPEKFAVYAESQGLTRRPGMMRQSYEILRRSLVRLILDDIKDIETAIRFHNQTDPVIQQALKVLKK